MKCKHFKVHAVTDQSILINWALIYCPDGLNPRSLLLLAHTQIAEPQQFVIASGTYLFSPTSAGAVALSGSRVLSRGI